MANRTHIGVVRDSLATRAEIRWVPIVTVTTVLVQCSSPTQMTGHGHGAVCGKKRWLLDQLGRGGRI